MDLITWILIIVFAALLIYFLRRRPIANLPPTKPGLPIIGNLHNIVYKNYQTFVDDLSLGDVFIFDIGIFKVTRLNSYRAIHEAFVNQAEVFSGRNKQKLMKDLGGDGGIVNVDGPTWQEHRRLMLRLLRDFGVGRPTMTNIVQEEVEEVVKQLSENDGKPTVTEMLFSSMTNNMITRLIFGERCGSEDKDFQNFMENINEIFKIRPINIIPHVFPWILKVDFLKRQFSIFKSIEGMIEYIQKKVDAQAELLNSMDPPLSDISQASNICEAFLIEKSAQEKENPGHHTFTDRQIVLNMTDLFTAGTETTATTLGWAFLLLSVNQEVQQLVQQEIAEKIGCERLPTTADRQEVPYVCAVMDEVLRYSSLVPLNIPHRVIRDTEVLGFHIPQDMRIQCNLYGIHHDPKTWERPNDFFPGHFLTPEGEYRSSKFLIPFSMGKRACLGEGLARTEFFIALVRILQKFQVRLSDNDADVASILEGKMQIIRHPGDHELVFQRIGSEE